MMMLKYETFTPFVWLPWNRIEWSNPGWESSTHKSHFLYFFMIENMATFIKQFLQQNKSSSLTVKSYNHLHITY